MREKRTEPVTVPLSISQVRTLDEYRAKRIPTPTRQEIIRELVDSVATASPDCKITVEREGGK